ncbi:MAG: glycosyltransferase family 8 protein [Butyrivibrio sp.]|nr:glycosyltransferase family 8 protein [Butyrivibrio sp.]
MNIVTALNKKYIPYTAVMLASLGQNNTNEQIEVFLLNSELSEDDIRDMNEKIPCDNIILHSVPVDRSLFDDRLPHNDQWSIETYYRLMMLELLPKEVGRALYLDGDMIVNKPLDELYNMPFDGNDIIACDDKGGLNLAERYGEKHNEMFKEAYEHGFRYFNAGVMVLNIEQMRENYSFDTYLDAIRAWNYEMEAPDQDILNWVHLGKVGYADHIVYDLFARAAHNAKITYEVVKEGVAIIHYAGAKPWNNESVHFDIEKIWWEYAKKTGYYNELMEDFVNSAMADTTVENYIEFLINSKNEMEIALEKASAALRSFASLGAGGGSERDTV